MAEIFGQATYPGIVSLVSCTYTCSHGISPGVANLVVLPQDTPFAPEGDLVIFDNNASVTIRDCLLDEVRIDTGAGGQQLVTISLKDRRWRWLDFGGIFGSYNQLDAHSKLIPWTIRSPQELVTLCLEELKETNYYLQLPPGLDKAFGEAWPDRLHVGEQMPLTGTNPAVNWLAEQPAHALQNLADLFGCRVVYDPVMDRVLVVPIGQGNALPPGSVHRYGPSLKSVPTPDGVAVVGAPTKYQARFKLEAVGIEWDGSYRPINQLSYTPILHGAVQITKITLGKELTNFNGGTWKLNVNGVDFVYQFDGLPNLNDISGELASQIGFSADPNIRGKITVNRLDEATIILTGIPTGWPFAVVPTVLDPNNGFMNQVELQAASPDGRGWDFSPPPTFPNIQTTNRLTYTQAIGLAAKSVFRCYQLSDVDADGQGGPINIPGYGLLARKQQIMLLDTMVDQVVPEPPNPNFININNPIDPNGNPPDLVAPFIQNFYSGYSRDKPAVAYGRFDPSSIEVWYIELPGDDNNNTPGNRIVQVPFSIDPEYQVICFAQSVLVFDIDRVVAAELTLETGCYIRDEDDNSLDCYILKMPLGGAATAIIWQEDDLTNYEISRRPDVQLSVIGNYNFALAPNGKDYHSVSTGATLLEADPLFRATYYANAMMLKYQIKGAQTVDYNAIVPVPMDGATTQTTYSVGGGKRCNTIASQNCEHSSWTPPYPARRRIEALRPAQQQQIRQANGLENVDMLNP